MKEILELVEKYINEKHANKKWVAGRDWVQYSGPFFNSDEYVAAVKTLLNEWLVLGGDGMQFEKEFPLRFGKEFGVLTNSGSSSNLLMVASLKSKRLYNLPKGSKILTPIAGFPTTFNPIIQMGFSPVLVDIELDTLNLDLDQVEMALEIHGDIRGIMFAHVLGNTTNMDRLMGLVKKHNLIFFEDCCDALGSTYDGKSLGSFGDMSSCSFYPAHHITCGEGGFVATKTKEQDTVVRSLREWGRGCYCAGLKSNLAKKGCCGKRFSPWINSLPNEIFDHKYVYEEIGYNMKPIELQASMLLQQMKKLDEIHSKRKENYRNLFKVFSQYEQYFHLPEARKKCNPSWFAFPLTIRSHVPFKRSDFCQFLEDNKIQTRNYFAGCFALQPAYDHMMNPKEVIRDYPVATKVTTDTFFLGTSPVLNLEKINYIEEVVKKFFKNV